MSLELNPEFELKSLVDQDPEQLQKEDVVASNTVYLGVLTDQNPEELDVPSVSQAQLGYEADDTQMYKEFSKIENPEVESQSWWDLNITQPSIRMGTRLNYWAGGLTGDAVKAFGEVTGKQFIYDLGDSISSWAEDYEPAMQEYAELRKLNKITGDEEFILDTVEFLKDTTMNITTGAFKAPVSAAAGIAQPIEAMLGIDTTDEEASLSAILGTLVDDINIEQEKAYQEIKQEEGSLEAITFAITQTIGDVRGNLQLMQSLGLRLPQGIRGKATTEKGKIALERLKRAGLIAAYTGLTTRGDAKTRGKAAATTMVYMSTPALSGWFDNKWKVIGADFALNSLWSASPLWKNGNDYASIWRDKDLDLTDKMARTISILGTDAFFSIATTSFKDSPDYKKMSTVEKGLFEAVVDAAQKSVSQNNPEWRAFETPQSIAQRNAAQNNGGFINVHKEDVVAKKAITDIATKLETDIKKIETSDAPKPTSYEGKVLLLDTINKFKDAPQSLQISEIKKTQAAIDKGENASTLR